MFLGHVAVGFAAKKLAPHTSLATLMAAPLLVDLVWPIFVLLGVEHVRIAPGFTAVTPLDFYDYPYTHSLAAGAGWALLLAGGHWWLRRDRRVALVLAAGVLSHWVLDFVSHAPDMPLYPGGDTRLGLGLWSSLGGTLVVELLMLSGGVALYVLATRPRGRVGTLALAAFLATLGLAYLSALFGPPPPNVTAVAVFDLLLWLTLPWVRWIDRHREARAAG